MTKSDNESELEKSKLRKSVEHFIKSMSSEEFSQSLIDARFDHYKDVKVPVFTYPLHDNVFRCKCSHCGEYTHFLDEDGKVLTFDDFEVKEKLK